MLKALILVLCIAALAITATAGATSRHAIIKPLPGPKTYQPSGLVYVR